MSAVADWLRRSISPSVSCGPAPAVEVVLVGQRRPDEPALELVVQSAEHQAEEPQLAVGLGPVERPRGLEERRTGGQQLGGDAQRPRRRVGVLEVGGVDDHAGDEAGGELPVRGVEADVHGRRQERRHLARRGGGRVDPVDGTEARVRDVVVDVQDRHPAEQLGVVGQDAPGRARARRSRRPR